MTVPVPGSLTYSYDEDGITTVFAYPVRFFEPQELEVVREVGGVHTTLTYNVDYTVSGAGSPSGGSITRAAATDGGKIIITRNTAWKQSVDLTNNGRNPAESVEQQLDRLTMAGQDARASVDTLLLKTGELDEAVTRAEAAKDDAEGAKDDAEAAQLAAEAAQVAAENAATSLNLPTIGAGDAGKSLIVKQDETGYEFGGGGDVIGPSSAADGHAAVFDGTTGKIIKSAGKAPFSGDYSDLDNKPTLGSAAAEDVSAFATAAQGDKADSALQTANVATFTQYNSATADKVLEADSVWADNAVLTDGATIAVDFNNGFDFSGSSNGPLLLGGNRTLGAPTNVRNSKKGILWFGATGSTRTLTLDAAWNLATGVEAGPYSITTSQELGVAYVTRGTTIVVTAIIRRG